MATFNESGSGGILAHGFTSFHYSYEGSGVVETYGCAKSVVADFIFASYGPGDIVFSVLAANQGKLEKVCIKTVALNCYDKNCAVSGAGCFPLYRDKFNSVWTDNELTTQSGATVLVQSYIDTVAIQEEDLARSCQW